MEQHPVPQNVTSFQFRLIGDMTIKQFGYLAGGAILAFISYKLPLPFFFTWPLTVLFGFLGIGFAFIPIEERPMDVWVISFLRNVYSPTQFIWHRVPATPEPTVKTPQQQMSIPQQPTSGAVSQPTTTTTSPPANPTPREQNKTGLSDTVKTFYSTQPTQIPIEVRKSWFEQLFGWVDALFPGTKPKQFAHQSKTMTAPPSPPVVTAMPPKPLPVTPPEAPVPQPIEPVVKIEQKPTQATAKQETGAPIPTLPQSPNEPTGPVRPKTVPDPTVKVFTPEGATRAGLPRLTTFSNVVTGIVKDHQGALLPGVLVTVKDKDGIPLRALKTNKLGQFAASTQLPDGVYVVEVEDPRERYVFDRAQITLNGTVMPAIGIVAKSKREIDRENLAKQIFGQTTNS